MTGQSSKPASSGRTSARGDLRVYLTVQDLQPQFAAYMGTPTRARGYPPLAGQHALIMEVAPGLMIERVIDIALKADPDLEPGILFVERQFGILELHGDDEDALLNVGNIILKGIGLDEGEPLRPRILYTDVIEDVSDQHAVIINRNRQASMITPGETLLICEMVPALYAAIAANEAERVAPDLTLVDVQMIGAAGRIYLSGRTEDVLLARDRIETTLNSIGGRES
ncbi:MAG: microcompartment protein [Anderseniella sp.]